MHQRFLRIVLLAFFAVTSGCASWYRYSPGHSFYPGYDLIISKVHVKRNQESSTPLTVPLAIKKGTRLDLSFAAFTSKWASFEDDWLAWDWTINERKLDVKLRNKTKLSLTIQWDQSTVTSINGTKDYDVQYDRSLAHVYDVHLHSGTKDGVADRAVEHRDRVHLKAATSLDPGSTRRESVYPADLLYWAGGASSPDKYRKRLVPGMRSTPDYKEAEDFARLQLGKSMVLTVPVESSGELREYTIVFTVDSYHIEKAGKTLF